MNVKLLTFKSDVTARNKDVNKKNQNKADSTSLQILLSQLLKRTMKNFTFMTKIYLYQTYFKISDDTFVETCEPLTCTLFNMKLINNRKQLHLLLISIKSKLTKEMVPK